MSANTLIELESGVPGGFTGARLSGVNVLGPDRVLEWVLTWPGETADGSGRSAILRVTGVEWLEFDRRDPKDPAGPPAMTLMSAPLTSVEVAELGFPAIPDGAFAHRLHAGGTDGAMCFAARAATLEWLTD